MRQKIIELLPPRIYLELRHWDYRLSHKSQFKDALEMSQKETVEGYSYKPFDDKKSIFIHIPKCAGVSVARTIFGNLAGGHTTLEQYLSIFQPSLIVKYFKFTIVRNPWDRLVSAYFFLSNGGFGEKDQAWFKSELESFSGFDDFVENWVNRKNIWKWNHFRPQYHYMLDKRGKVPLDFVGFFENINEDFKYIADRTGTNCTLPELNISRHSSYMEHYSEKTLNIVADVYAEDIKMLGYNFDNSSVQAQLASRFPGKNYAVRS